jgi:hypothetical protein
MQCLECGSTHIRKNGKKQGKQNHICVACGRQFIDQYAPPQGYGDQVKRECLKLYLNAASQELVLFQERGYAEAQGFDCYCTTSNGGMYPFRNHSYRDSATPLFFVATLWVVERSNAWMERCKSLVKNFERTLDHDHSQAQSLFHPTDAHKVGKGIDPK